MKRYTTTLVSTALLAGTAISANADTFTGIKQAVAEGQVDLSLRYRFEHVDQDGIDKDANASTLKTRLGYQTGQFNGLFAKIELDNVTAIGNENYNSTVNGNTRYPVVADPTDTDLNQAYIGYKTGNVAFYAGRQRIVHANQRFVGGVAWRQNEQTFDGYRITYDDKQNISIDYSYIHNVNRIFGPRGDRADLGGNLHLFNSQYRIDDMHAVKLHVYALDFDTALALSSRTLGVAYDGTFAAINLHLAYASQSDSGDNPAAYSADYWNAEVGGTLAEVKVAVGVESLGSDNGRGFSTPLATLHKFQGFADKFLVTPTTGVEDVYIKAGKKFGKLQLNAIWHDLSSDTGGIDYGTELNLVAKYPITKGAGLLIKYADYNADDFATDTRKFWAMVNVNF